ncbi:hypothetical protein EON73_04630 [bacterium]|nr:MAG: hypothetical protein EON73_04630 [bacterium]
MDKLCFWITPYKSLYGSQTPYKACTKLVLAKTEFLHAKLCKLCTKSCAERTYNFVLQESNR